MGIDQKLGAASIWVHLQAIILFTRWARIIQFYQMLICWLLV